MQTWRPADSRTSWQAVNFSSTACPAQAVTFGRQGECFSLHLCASSLLHTRSNWGIRAPLTRRLTVPTAATAPWCRQTLPRFHKHSRKLTRDHQIFRHTTFQDRKPILLATQTALTAALRCKTLLFLKQPKQISQLPTTPSKSTKPKGKACSVEPFSC